MLDNERRASAVANCNCCFGMLLRAEVGEDYFIVGKFGSGSVVGTLAGGGFDGSRDVYGECFSVF